MSNVGDVSLRLALDTASADLWVVSTNCTHSKCNLPKYPLAFQSPTFVSVNSNTTAFGVSFADGTSTFSYFLRRILVV